MSDFAIALSRGRLVADTQLASLCQPQRPVVEFKPPQPATIEDLPIGLIVKAYLRLNGHHDWERGLTTAELSQALTKGEAL